MPQCTSATFSRVERADPGERHARPDRPPPSIDRWIGRISTKATSRCQHDGVCRAPEPRAAQLQARGLAVFTPAPSGSAASGAVAPVPRSRNRSCAKGGRKTYRHKRSTPPDRSPTPTRWRAGRTRPGGPPAARARLRPPCRVPRRAVAPAPARSSPAPPAPAPRPRRSPPLWGTRPRGDRPAPSGCRRAPGRVAPAAGAPGGATAGG
jgi:hypothetical protein